MKKLFAVLLVLVLVLSSATCFAAPAPKGPGAPKPAAPAGPVAPKPEPPKPEAPKPADPKPAGPAEKAKADAIIAQANAQIYALVIAAQATPEDDTDALVAATEAIAAAAKAAVAKLGLEAACQYTTYIVDGKKVTIDPLYVVNPLKKKKSVDDDGDKK